MSSKKLSYKGYKNILNRAAYKLIKSGKKYVHTKNEYTVGGEKKSYNTIIKTIKANGTKYTNDRHIARFMEDVITNTDKTQLPGYVMGSSGVNKYNRASYMNMVKTVKAYRTKHGANPTKITVTYEKISKNCQNPYTSKPHYTDYGCNKLGQCTPYYCGPHSIHQGLKKFGITQFSESQLASWAGTTTSGSDHDGLNTAIKYAAKKAGINVDITWYNFSELGNTDAARFKKLGEMICNPNAFGFCHIWYKDGGKSTSGEGCGHYEMLDIINTSDKEVRALNSLGSRDGNAYYGHLQWRSFGLQSAFIKGISQKSICIVTRK